MNIKEDEPRLNPVPQNTDTLFERVIEKGNRAIDAFTLFMIAPVSLAQSYRERHPKIAKAITVGALVPPVLLGAVYARASGSLLPWESGSLLPGLSAGSDVWILECAAASIWSRTHPSIKARL
ncbi:hypothetical protein HYU94_03720 [Candidatus Daviesbacteria bacterium]|nr:hypothetical protein [Candidatus Daviesbacteria bacterium]